MWSIHSVIVFNNERTDQICRFPLEHTECLLLKGIYILLKVMPVARSLNSSDVFVVHASNACYIWVGKGSIGDEREIAREVARAIGKSEDTDLVMEGRESDKFWATLGGKADYGSAKQMWVCIYQVISCLKKKMWCIEMKAFTAKSTQIVLKFVRINKNDYFVSFQN